VSGAFSVGLGAFSGRSASKVKGSAVLESVIV